MEQSCWPSVEGIDNQERSGSSYVGLNIYGMPTHINIIGRPYAVVYDAALSKSVGEQHAIDLVIKIKPGMKQFVEAETLLHETIHGIDEAMQLNMSERQVYCLAAGLMAMLSENQNYLEYLNKALKK